MTEFHASLDAVHVEIWEGGTGPSDLLDAKLSDLRAAPLPLGIARLPSSRLTAGPHLATQAELAPASAANGGSRDIPGLRTVPF